MVRKSRLLIIGDTTVQEIKDNPCFICGEGVIIIIILCNLVSHKINTFPKSTDGEKRE